MKYRVITREHNLIEWLELEGCDDCTTINSNMYIELSTESNNKSIILCKECFRKIVKEYK